MASKSHHRLSNVTVNSHSYSDNVDTRLNPLSEHLTTRGPQSNTMHTRGQPHSEHMTSKRMDVGEALSWLKEELVSTKNIPDA